jgi:hypothetical protein
MVLFEGPDRVIALVEYSLYHLCRSKKEREREREKENRSDGPFGKPSFKGLKIISLLSGRSKPYKSGSLDRESLPANCDK